jgi:predicted acylesterase/phospholipase RssA
VGELERHYQIYTGVSVGAINIAFLSQFPDNQAVESANQLCDLWSNIREKDILKPWQPFGAWQAIWRSSFYDSSQLHKLVKGVASLDRIRATGKEVRVGAVSLNTGKYCVFDQKDDAFLDAVCASASFPSLMSPVKIRDQLWMDGGTKTISPIQLAIDLGADECDIVVTSPEIRVQKYIEHPTTIDVIKRAFDVSTDKILSNDIEKVLMYNELAKAGISGKKYVKLNIIRPKHNLIEDSFDFSPNKLKNMMELGYEDAKRVFQSV